MNYGRIIGAGLLAGLALNIGDMLAGMVLFKDDMQALVERLHLDPTVLTSMSGIIPWVVVDFILGILIVFNYAAMRPRFGPGPKTAVVAALVIFAAMTLLVYGFVTMGIFDRGPFVKQTLFYLINMSVGALIGAWAYKEA